MNVVKNPDVLVKIASTVTTGTTLQNVAVNHAPALPEFDLLLCVKMVPNSWRMLSASSQPTPVASATINR